VPDFGRFLECAKAADCITSKQGWHMAADRLPLPGSFFPIRCGQSRTHFQLMPTTHSLSAA
jgi:hypothetical protein